MPKIHLKTTINADIRIVFDLSRSVDLHQVSASETDEKVIGGIMTGLMNLNDEVVWQGKHLGITQRLSSKITQMEYPDRFTDEMVKGFFKSFKHEHIFMENENKVTMIDNFEYQMHFGIFGRLLNWIILEKHMINFLTKRNITIKQYAETDLWKTVLKNPSYE